jgi:hypothetical protein
VHRIWKKLVLRAPSYSHRRDMYVDIFRSTLIYIAIVDPLQVIS